MEIWEYEQLEEYDRILGQTTGLFAQRGEDQIAALLVDVRSIDLVDTDEVIRNEVTRDPWDPERVVTITTYRRAAVFDVDEHLIARFTDEVRKRIAETCPMLRNAMAS